MSQPCQNEDRIIKLEINSNTLIERVDNLIQRIDRNTKVSTTLIITIISGIVVVVVGGALLALLTGLVSYFVIKGA